MMTILMFALVLAATFGAVLWVTKPTKSEAILEQRLSGLGRHAGPDTLDEPEDLIKRVTYSDLPFLDSVLQRVGLAGRIHDLLRQANSEWSVGRVLFGSILLLVIVAGLAGLWLHNFGIGLLAGIVAGASPYVYLSVKRSARLRQFNQLLPEAIDLMSRALRAGHAVTAAIEMVSREIADPVGTEFRRSFEEQNFGLPLREALINLAQRVPIADLKFLVTAILVQKETGGNLAEVLDKTAIVIRERGRLLGQLRIYTAQGRLTGWILGILPFLMFVLLHFANPGYTAVLLDDPLGQKLVWTGIALMAVGIYIIRKIVDIKV